MRVDRISLDPTNRMWIMLFDGKNVGPLVVKIY